MVLRGKAARILEDPKIPGKRTAKFNQQVDDRASAGFPATPHPTPVFFGLDLKHSGISIRQRFGCADRLALALFQQIDCERSCYIARENISVCICGGSAWGVSVP
jgi:hypothetical protein